MEPKMLDARHQVDMETGCLCRYVRSDTEYLRPHYHNYYELFLVVKGSIHHIVNDREQILSVGQLLFIRDFDLHDYKLAEGEYFEFINLAFTKEAFRSMLTFLGSGFPVEPLLTAEFPPIVNLLPHAREKLAYSLIELNQNADKKEIYFKARALLVSVFTEYFYNYHETRQEIPFWLSSVYEKMKRPQNFIAGAGQMYELSGKSREHVTRCMQQYYQTTPTAYVSDLRLGHAANLLLVSNLSVTDICYECGFENLSWFYKRFAKKYGFTPSEYRKQYKSSVK